VPEARRIGRDNVDTVRHSTEANCVEDLCRAKRCQRVTNSHEDQAERGEADHDREAFGATPKVEKLGCRNVHCSSHGIGDDGDYCE
jgi:hypothetical protein